MRICRVFCLFAFGWSLALSGEYLAPIKSKRSVMRRYQPTRGLFCMGCQPRHRHILLVDIQVTDAIKKCSVAEIATHASQLQSIRQRLRGDDIILVTCTTGQAPAIMTAMAREFRNVSVLTYKRSAGLTRACRNLRDRCYYLDSLTPIISQIQSSQKKERRLASYNTYWAAGSENIGNFSVFKRQIDMLESELCKRDRSQNRLVEVNESQFA